MELGTRTPDPAASACLSSGCTPSQFAPEIVKAFFPAYNLAPPQFDCPCNLPPEKGDVVRLRDAAWSRKAQVVGSPYPRSYLVKTEDQKLLRRSRRHLLQTGERFIEESGDDIDTSSADNNVGGHPTVATSTSPANGRRREAPTSGDPSPPVIGDAFTVQAALEYAREELRVDRALQQLAAL
ncbi:hypothetical protein MRX96_034289 [Rhipicephalus microplus]